MIHPLPVTGMPDLVTIGQLLARTEMVGARNDAEGFVVACICHQQGITYAQFAETYNLVYGRISKRADAMLADLVKLGGKYKIKSRTADESSVEVSYADNKQTFTLTWDEAQGEPFVRAKDGKALKKQYATPRGRTQMLWARVVSDAIRAMCPAANAGYYTPEEVEDFAAPETETVVIDAPASPQQAAPPVIPQQPANEYHACPMEGPLQGKPWADMPDEHLHAALGVDHGDMTDGHRAQIRAILEQRGAAQ